MENVQDPQSDRLTAVISRGAETHDDFLRMARVFCALLEQDSPNLLENVEALRQLREAFYEMVSSELDFEDMLNGHAHILQDGVDAILAEYRLQNGVLISGGRHI